LTKNSLSRTLTPEYNQLLDQFLKIFGDAVGLACGTGRRGEIDRIIRAGIDVRVTLVSPRTLLGTE